MRKIIREYQEVILNFLKDRSKWVGLSFVVLAVVLYASVSGIGKSDLTAVELAGNGETAPVQEEIMVYQESSDPDPNEEESEKTDKTGDEGTVSSRQEGSETSPETVSYEDDEICVFVCGAVVREGVYRLPAGSRAYEAVAAAGGFTEDADQTYVNQAEILSDSDELRIPTVEEAEAMETTKEDTGIISAEKKKNDTSETNDLININTADKEELMTLPGIGESKAEAILSYREKNGSFQSVEEIKNISGIKEGVYSKIEDKICTE